MTLWVFLDAVVIAGRASITHALKNNAKPADPQNVTKALIKLINSRKIGFPSEISTKTVFVFAILMILLGISLWAQVWVVD